MTRYVFYACSFLLQSFVFVTCQFEDEEALFPVMGNVARKAIVTANATCGQYQMDYYCRLIHGDFFNPWESQFCYTCDSSSFNPSKRHPVENIVDGSEAWWQSPTLANGEEFDYVTVTLDLQQVYQVSYIRLEVALSPRPGNWILEKSLDGKTFMPWQYFAISDAECWMNYGLAPMIGRPKHLRDNQPICTSYFSRRDPIQNGTVFVSLFRGRQSAFNPSQTLKNFLSARYIRLRLQKMQKLDNDEVILTMNRPDDVNEAILRRYFYTIKELKVGARCECNGHAKSCIEDSSTGEPMCVCEHNTCGASCNMCCPKYKKKPWQPATNNNQFTCEVCDDDCSGTLMTSLDALDVDMQHLLELNLTNLPPPFHRAEQVLNKTLNLQKQLLSMNQTDLESLESLLKETQENVSTTLVWTNRTLMNSWSVSNSRTNFSQNLNITDQSILRLEEDLKDDMDGLEEMVKKLLQNTSALNTSTILPQAQQLLMEIRIKIFKKFDKAARREHDEAEKSLKRVKELGMRQLNTSSLEWKLDQLKSQLNELNSHINASLGGSLKASELYHSNEKLFNSTEELLTLLDRDLSDIEEGVRSAQGEDLLLNAVNDLKISETKLDILKGLAERLNIKEKVIRNGLTQSEESVKAAWGHALILLQDAFQLNETFSGARRNAVDPIVAGSAYKNIVTAVEKARMSANRSLVDVDLSIAMAKNKSLNNELQESVSRNEDISSGEQDVTLNITSLQDRFEGVSEDMVHSMRNMNQSEDKLRLIQEHYNVTTTGFDERVINIADILSMVEESSGQVSETVDNITSAILPHLNTVDPETGIKKYEYNISLAVENSTENVHNIEQVTKWLHQKVLEISHLKSNLSNKVEALKEKILLARNEANAIKASLSSSGYCVRSYQVPEHEATTNNIQLQLNPNNTKEDMIVLLLQNAPNEYIGVEIKGGKIAMSWNLGGGQGEVIHPEPLLDLDGQDIWYNIEINRSGRLGMLKVKPMFGLHSETVEKSNMSPPGSSMLAFGNHSQLYVSGLPHQYQRPIGMSGRNFSGCIGNVFVEGKRIGLFNFLQSSDHCSACLRPPSIESSTSGVYQFNGDGYAALSDSQPYGTTRYVVSFQLKTVWGNSLLLLSINSQSGDFLSLEMRDGHIVFQFYLGGTGLAFLRSKQKYNVNKWVHLTATQHQSKVVLELSTEGGEKEIVEGETSLPNKGLEFTQQTIYFGGLPKSLQLPRNWQIEISTDNVIMETSSYLGCMRDVQMGSQRPAAIDLLKGDNVGVTEGCKVSRQTLVGFLGTGYLEVEGRSLSKGSTNISVTFRTLYTEGLILLSVSNDTEHFYSIALVNGLLQLRVSDGSGVVVLTAESNYTDGLPHVVYLVKQGFRIKMFVDDTLVERGELPVSSEEVHFCTDCGLYVGGVPEGLDTLDKVATSTTINGCIQDIIINERLVHFDDSVSYWRADIGRCSQLALSSIFAPPDVSRNPPFWQGSGISPSVIDLPTLPDTSTEGVSYSLTEKTEKKLELPEEPDVLLPGGSEPPIFSRTTTTQHLENQQTVSPTNNLHPVSEQSSTNRPLRTLASTLFPKKPSSTVSGILPPWLSKVSSTEGIFTTTSYPPSKTSPVIENPEVFATAGANTMSYVPHDLETTSDNFVEKMSHTTSSGMEYDLTSQIHQVTEVSSEENILDSGKTKKKSDNSTTTSTSYPDGGFISQTASGETNNQGRFPVTDASTVTNTPFQNVTALWEAVEKDSKSSATNTTMPIVRLEDNQSHSAMPKDHSTTTELPETSESDGLISGTKQYTTDSKVITQMKTNISVGGSDTLTTTTTVESFSSSQTLMQPSTTASRDVLISKSSLATSETGILRSFSTPPTSLVTETVKPFSTIPASTETRIVKPLSTLPTSTETRIVKPFSTLPTSTETKIVKPFSTLPASTETRIVKPLSTLPTSTETRIVKPFSTLPTSTETKIVKPFSTLPTSTETKTVKPFSTLPTSTETRIVKPFSTLPTSTETRIVKPVSTSATSSITEIGKPFSSLQTSTKNEIVKPSSTFATTSQTKILKTNSSQEKSAHPTTKSKLPFSTTESISETFVNRSYAGVGTVDNSRTQSSSHTIIPSVTIQGVSLSVPTTVPSPSASTSTTSIPTSPSTACAAEDDYQQDDNSISFGNTQYSFAAINVEKRTMKKNFTISFDFRSYYPDGMFFYLTNGAESHFLTGQLLGGRVVVTYKDQTGGDIFISTPNLYSDGLWHAVYIAKMQKELSITVDESPVLRGVVENKINSPSSMYIGGLPQKFNLDKGLASHSVRGCLRKFSVNTELFQLKDASVISGVGPCYSKVEHGAYFTGDSYGVFAQKFTIGKALLFALSFRTHKKDGVLLTVSSYKGSPAIALELHQGKLKFNMRSSAGVFTAESEYHSEFALCDQRWHRVKAEVIQSVITLRVDEGPTSYAFDRASSRGIRSRHPLYIGGYPDYAGPQGASYSQSNFEGCMKNVFVNGIPIDWFNIFHSVEINKVSCPLL